MRNFPAPGEATRRKLGSGRWTGLQFNIADTWVGVAPVEIVSGGRRVVVHANVLRPLIDVFDTVLGAQEPAMLNPDPLSRIILWFNAIGVENLVTSPNAAQNYYRLEGTGIYLPLTTPVDYVATFDRLFLDVRAYAQGSSPVELCLNIENWTQDQGDRS